MMKVAIVILNWNGQQMLADYLGQVVEYSKDEAEIIVADNGSTDDSVEWVRTHFPEVRIIQLDRNYGFAEGYNKALVQVDCTYYVLLNSDVEVTPHWLTPLIEEMDARPEVAACQPKILSEVRKGSFEYAGACGGYIDRFGYPFCRGRIFDTVEEDHGQYDTPQEVLWASGCCLMIRADDYWSADGLDGRFFAHNEEIDLCWRLYQAGRKIFCFPQSTVYHVGGGTLPKGNPWKTFLNFRNNLTMLWKNLPEDGSSARHAVALAPRLCGSLVDPHRPAQPRRLQGHLPRTQGLSCLAPRFRYRPLLCLPRGEGEAASGWPKALFHPLAVSCQGKKAFLRLAVVRLTPTCRNKAQGYDSRS